MSIASVYALTPLLDVRAEPMIPTTYEEWRACITVKCGLTLSAAYCAERRLALCDPADPMTRRFLELYGEARLSQTVAWFERAEREASS